MNESMNLVLVLVGLTFAPTQSIDARELAFFHTHTGRSLSIVYHHDGRYDADALAQVDDFLKDFRTGTLHPIDPDFVHVDTGRVRYR